MSWVKIDDSFLDHAKFIEAGPLCGYMNICAIAWSNRNKRDGRIPRAQVSRLANFEGIAWECWMGELVGGGKDVDPIDVAERLVEVGLWERDGRDYLIHDYLDYQSSREEIEAASERNRKAGRLGGRKRSAKRGVSEPLSEVSSAALAKRQAERQAKSKQEVRSKKEEATANAVEKTFSPEVIELAEHLAARMRQHDPKTNLAHPESKAWRNALRLMIEQDGEEPSEIRRLIDAAQDDPFWHTVILSPANLRAKASKLRLRLQAAQLAGHPALKPVPDPKFDVYDKAAGL